MARHARVGELGVVDRAAPTRSDVAAVALARIPAAAWSGSSVASYAAPWHATQSTGVFTSEAPPGLHDVAVLTVQGTVRAAQREPRGVMLLLHAAAVDERPRMWHRAQSVPNSPVCTS